MKAVNDLERLVPGFWEHAECTIGLHLAVLGVELEDITAIILDLMPRLARIDAAIPYAADDQFWRDYASLICDACSAQQRILAAKSGRMPGGLLGDWPPTPISYEQPFLKAIQQVVSELEAVANSLRNRAELH